MSSRFLVAAALALTAASARAQSTSDTTAMLRARVALLDSLFLRQEQLREENRRAEVQRRPARMIVVSGLTMLLPEDVPRAIADSALHALDSTYLASGLVEQADLEPIILVVPGTYDRSFLDRPEYKARPQIEVDWRPTNGSHAIDGMIRPISRYLDERLDPAWRAWSPWYAVRWGPNDRNYELARFTSEGIKLAGKECLAGLLASCRAWLGLDADSNVFTTRYRPSELMDAARWVGVNREGSVACQAGNMEACERVFSRGGLDSIPADGVDGASLMRAVLERHGVPAVRAAIKDRRGSIGERLARATGLPEDSLVSEWRMWVLGGNRVDRVQAGPGEALSALACSALLLGLALRGGRWR